MVVLQILESITLKAPNLRFLISNIYIVLLKNITGKKNRRKWVAPPKSILLPYANREGNITEGRVFLKPNLKTENVRVKLTRRPTSSCGDLIINGADTERSVESVI